MIRPLSRTYFLLVIVIFTACKKDDPQNPDPPDPIDETIYVPTTTLKAAASFPVGLAVSTPKFDGATYTQTATSEFNSFTAEWEMKQNIILPAKDQYAWNRPDEVVNFAKSRGSRMHGHALIWHSSTPDWLVNFTGDSTAFEHAVRDYIKTVVGRYKDDVASWDVVNEAVEDNSGQLRNTVFLQRMGPGYIARCFQYAREADPDVMLFYNDYGSIWDSQKLTKIVELINDFKNQGVPIDGFGFQMHITTEFPTYEQIKNAVDAVVATGVKIHFSELDIRVNPQNTLNELTYDAALSQQQRFKQIVELYQTIPAEQQFGITLWGLRDNESWLLDFWKQPDWPLLFNKNFKHKIAHKGFVEGLN